MHPSHSRDVYRLLMPPTTSPTTSLTVHLAAPPSSSGMTTSPISPMGVSGDAWLMSTCKRTRGRNPKTEHTTFTAYCDDCKGWEFLDHETGSRVVSRDVLWQENAFRHTPWNSLARAASYVATSCSTQCTSSTTSTCRSTSATLPK